MQALGKLFGSGARTALLQVLFAQPGALGLRQAARLAGVHPHSAELALRDLMAEGVVRTVRAGATPLYEANTSCPQAAILQAVFEAAAQTVIRQRSPGLSARARTLLPLFTEASRMLAKARQAAHGS